MRIYQIDNDNDKHDNDTFVFNDSENDNHATIASIQCQYNCTTIVRCHVVVS